MLKRGSFKLKEVKVNNHPLPYAYSKVQDAKLLKSYEPDNQLVFGVIYETGKGKNKKIMNWSIVPSESLVPSVLDWYLKVVEVIVENSQTQMHFDDEKLKQLFHQIKALENWENFKESKRKKAALWLPS